MNIITRSFQLALEPVLSKTHGPRTKQAEAPLHLRAYDWARKRRQINRGIRELSELVLGQGSDVGGISDGV